MRGPRIPSLRLQKSAGTRVYLPTYSWTYSPYTICPEAFYSLALPFCLTVADPRRYPQPHRDDETSFVILVLQDLTDLWHSGTEVHTLIASLSPWPLMHKAYPSTTCVACKVPV